MYVVTGVVGVDVTVGALVTVTVLVLVDGGGTSTVVVTVLTLVVVDDDVAAAAVITPQAIRLPASSMAPAPRFHSAHRRNELQPASDTTCVAGTGPEDPRHGDPDGNPGRAAAHSTR